MQTNGRRRNPLLLAFGITAVVVIVGGILLGFFGVGAQLAKPRTVVVVIRNKGVEPEIAKQIKVGDSIFTDAAGIEIGRISKVAVTPQQRVLGDQNGKLHLANDPLSVQVDTTIEAQGREGNGLVLLNTQVVQSGQVLNLISKRYYISGTVVSIDVR